MILNLFRAFRTGARTARTPARGDRSQPIWECSMAKIAHSISRPTGDASPACVTRHIEREVDESTEPIYDRGPVISLPPACATCGADPARLDRYLSAQAPEHLVFDHQRCFPECQLKQHRATPLKPRQVAHGAVLCRFSGSAHSKFSSRYPWRTVRRTLLPQLTK